MTRPRRADAGMFMNACLHCHLVEIAFTTNAEHHEISDGAAAACLSGDPKYCHDSIRITAISLLVSQLILSGKVDPETPDVYAAIMASSASVSRHHPDLARGGNSEYVQDVDSVRLRTLSFHNVESSRSASATSTMRTISHLVYVDPLSPPGRLLLLEAFKVNLHHTLDHFSLCLC
jgi:hypothetical protein